MGSMFGQAIEVPPQGSAGPLASYSDRVLATNPIGYWPLWETEGATAHDLSGSGCDGTVTGAAWGAEGIGDGHTALSFDGSGDVVDLYSAALANAFDGNEGALLLWIRTTTWADGVTRYALRIRVSDFNDLMIYKASTTNIAGTARTASSISKYTSINTAGAVDWLCVAMTWSRSTNEQRAYLNGAQAGSTLTGLGVWSGSPGTMVLGAGSAEGTSGVWTGALAHVALWGNALSPAVIAGLAGVT